MGHANATNNNGGGANNVNGQRERVRRSSVRGFAAMDTERRRLISSVGGKAAHQKGTGHEFTPEEAREAGRKGGRASAVARASRTRLPASEPAPVPPAAPPVKTGSNS